MFELKKLVDGAPSVRVISLERVPLVSARSASGYAFALLLVSLSVILVSGHSITPWLDEVKPLTIQQIAHLVCHNSKTRIQSIGQMLSVIRWVNVNENKCKSRFLSAIYELQPILQRSKESICDNDSFQLIKDYHFRFIQPPRKVNRAPSQFEASPNNLVKQQLHPEPRKYIVDVGEHDQVLIAPIEVRHFFLKFALQLSLQCKKNLVDNLEADVQRILDDQDRELMLMFGRESPIGQALVGDDVQYDIDFDNVIFMPELDGRMLRANGEEMKPPGQEQHLKTSASADSVVFQLINSCKNRYKPLYDRLIMPIVRLSKLGYDYQGSRGFTENERKFLEGVDVKNWLMIVHICEIFKNTVLVSIDDEDATRDAAPGLRDQLDKEESVESDKVADSGGLESERDENEEPAIPDDLPKTDEGILVAMGDEEAQRLEELARMEQRFKPLVYEPTQRHKMEDKLMIEREQDLDLELSRKHGPEGNPFGFRGFLRRLKSTIKRALAKLDMERFAHYRRNSLWYSGLLNFISSLSNVVSISVTVVGLTSAG